MNLNEDKLYLKITSNPKNQQPGLALCSKCLKWAGERRFPDQPPPCLLPALQGQQWRTQGRSNYQFPFLITLQLLPWAGSPSSGVSGAVPKREGWRRRPHPTPGGRRRQPGKSHCSSRCATTGLKIKHPLLRYKILKKQLSWLLFYSVRNSDFYVLKAFPNSSHCSKFWKQLFVH